MLSYRQSTHSAHLLKVSLDKLIILQTWAEVRSTVPKTSSEAALWRSQRHNLIHLVNYRRRAAPSQISLPLALRSSRINSAAMHFLIIKTRSLSPPLAGKQRERDGEREALEINQRNAKTLCSLLFVAFPQKKRRLLRETATQSKLFKSEDLRIHPQTHTHTRTK